MLVVTVFEGEGRIDEIVAQLVVVDSNGDATDVSINRNVYKFFLLELKHITTHQQNCACNFFRAENIYLVTVLAMQVHANFILAHAHMHAYIHVSVCVD